MNNVKPRLRAGLLLGAVVALAGVSWLSLSGTPTIPVGPKLDDKVNHFIAYATLAFLFAGSQKRPVAYVLTAAVLVIYGVGIEAAQGLMGQGREASFWDAVANCLGIAAGLLASRIMRAWIFPEPSGAARSKSSATRRP